MKIAILAKNPYYFKGEKIKPYLAGHSTGFIAPFIDFLLERNHKVTIISPKEEMDEKIKENYFPKVPSSRNFSNIFLAEKKIPKVPFNYGGLEVQAALLKAQKDMGGVELVLVVYIFPWISCINDIKEKLNFKTVAFLRGSDVFLGCTPDSEYKNLFHNGLWHNYRKIIIDSINKSDRVYSVSQMLKDYAQNLGIRVDRVSPTPPFSSEVIEGGKISLRKKLIDLGIIKPNLNNKWIIYLGRFHKEKQPEMVIKAYSKLKGNYTLIMAGLGLERKKLEKIKDKFNLKNVHFCFVPPKFVSLFCKCADVMVHPTTPNSFLDARPSACMNASYVGCPIVFPYKNGRICGGLNEGVSKLNVEKLTVDPFLKNRELIKEFSKKIKLVLEDKNLYKSISEENIKFTKRFNPDLIFKNIEKDLLKLVENEK